MSATATGPTAKLALVPKTAYSTSGSMLAEPHFRRQPCQQA